MQGTAARKRDHAERHEVEQELDLVYRQRCRRSLPDHLMLAASRHEIPRDPLRVAKIDLGA